MATAHEKIFGARMSVIITLAGCNHPMYVMRRKIGRYNVFIVDDVDTIFKRRAQGEVKLQKPARAWPWTSVNKRNRKYDFCAYKGVMLDDEQRKHSWTLKLRTDLSDELRLEGPIAAGKIFENGRFLTDIDVWPTEGRGSIGNSESNDDHCPGFEHMGV